MHAHRTHIRRLPVAAHVHMVQYDSTPNVMIDNRGVKEFCSLQCDVLPPRCDTVSDDVLNDVLERGEAAHDCLGLATATATKLVGDSDSDSGKGCKGPCEGAVTRPNKCDTLSTVHRLCPARACSLP